MFRNESVCCVCQKKNVQVHHIDGDNSNNKLSNLAVLCIEDHDRASSRSSMTRGLTPSLIRRFKTDWERRVIEKRRLVKHAASSIKEDPFIKFEIKRLVFSLPAFKDKKTTNSIIDQLYHWHLFTDYTKNIFLDLGNIRWFLDMSQIIILLERIYEFFWHLVGPKDVPMDIQDKKNLLLAIKLLGNLGIQIITLKESRKALDYLFAPADDFVNIAQLYRSPMLKKEIKNQLISIRRELAKTRSYPNRTKLTKKFDQNIKKI